MSQFESEGDNKEFAIASISDVTVHFGTSGKTSADDTATDKYFDNTPGDINSAKGIFLRCDQSILVVGMNAITFTDPIFVAKDTSIKETFATPFIFEMVIRTTVVNTNLKLRWK